jgi:hypothetical protein
MSDLQDLIAKNAVIAYNQGFERGEASERERIMKVLEEIKVINADQKYFVTQAIKGEQK